MRAFPSTALGTRRHESARPDPSLRNERLLGMTCKLHHYPRIVLVAAIGGKGVILKFGYFWRK